jgi:sirohydrochlorin ferrochelatase
VSGSDGSHSRSSEQVAVTAIPARTPSAASANTASTSSPRTSTTRPSQASTASSTSSAKRRGETRCRFFPALVREARVAADVRDQERALDARRIRVESGCGRNLEISHRRQRIASRPTHFKTRRGASLPQSP